MSELKVINAYQLTTNTEDSDVYIRNDDFGCGGDLVECYLKYEADKEIQRLEKLCENYRYDCDYFAIMTDKMRKAGRTLRQKMNHQKFKRCLAMARWCECERIAATDYTIEKWEFYDKWHKRWLKIAEQFKDKEA